MASLDPVLPFITSPRIESDDRLRILHVSPRVLATVRDIIPSSAKPDTVKCMFPPLRVEMVISLDSLAGGKSEAVGRL